MVMISQQTETQYVSSDRSDIVYANLKMKEFFGSESSSTNLKSKESKINVGNSHRKIFAYMSDLTSEQGTDVLSNPSSTHEKLDEHQQSLYEKFSLSEIVLRHQALKSQQHDMKFKRTVGRFSVERPNKYAALETDEAENLSGVVDQSKRIVEVKVFDVLHNLKVCNLVYMRDITKLVNEI